MASRHTCAKKKTIIFLKIIHTFKHTFNIVQKLGRHIIKHLHKEQCDESDQKGPRLSREIDEVHLYTFSLCSKGQQFHWSRKSWSEAFIPYYMDLLHENRKCVRVEPTGHVRLIINLAAYIIVMLY